MALKKNQMQIVNQAGVAKVVCVKGTDNIVVRNFMNRKRQAG